MGASGEEIGGLGGAEEEAFFFEKGHVPGEGGGVAGDVDQPSGIHAGDGLDGVGA